MSADAHQNERGQDHVGLNVGMAVLLASLSLLLVCFFVPVPVLVERLGVIVATSVCVVFYSTPLVIRAARRLGAVDVPGGRRIHDVPTPRLGGIAVYVGVVIALLLTSRAYMPNIKALLVGATLVFAVGVWDDLRGVSALGKLAAQLAACVVLILDGVHVTFLPATWWGVAGEWLITCIWIVGITNAINFLDGMDGIVTGLVAGTSAIYFALSLLMGSNMLAYCSVALLGAAIGFLGFNIRPARIFLGDGGSNFLGFFLAALSIQGEWARHDPLVSFFIPILILSVPIYDMVFTTIARILTGRVRSVKGWIEYTGLDHLHHRLERLGLSRGRVAVVMCFLNVAVGLGAITLSEARTYGGVALIVQAICVYCVVALLEILGWQKCGSAPNTCKENADSPARESC